MKPQVADLLSVNSVSQNYDRAVIWSATPTPFTEKMELDHASITRMVDHHVDLDINGLFIAGTCGEGPWMTSDKIVDLANSVSEANRGRMKIGVQVTENSAARTLKNIDMFDNESCDYVVVAQPALFMNSTPQRVLGYYREILDNSAKPVCFYNRGSRQDFSFESTILEEIYAHPAIHLIKDSSGSLVMRDTALKIRTERPELNILTGDEFSCSSYLVAGYDGFMTGGAILTGAFLRAMDEAFRSEDHSEMLRIEERAKRLLYACYGGEGFSCWLTGLKQTLVRLGIFSSAASILEYPFSEQCSAEIDVALSENMDWLLVKRALT